MLPGGKSVGAGKVAGYDVARYKWEGDRGSGTEMSFAPGLSCEVMEREETSPDTLGIPGGVWNYRVTAFKPGEPDRSLFHVPPDYIIEHSR